MTTLSNGAFVFLDEKSHLVLLAKGANCEPYIIYGCEVVSFAFSGDDSVVALAFPPLPGKSLSVVRLYAFQNDGLGDALGEVEVEATQLLWMGTRYLLVCSPAGCKIYTWNGGKLEFFVSDEATSSFLHVSCVGFFFEKKRTVEYWCLERNCCLDSIRLPSKGRQLISSSGAGYFGFALYHDGSVFVFYMLKSSVKKLEMFECLFSASSVASSLKNGGLSPLLVCPLSSRKVLLGLRGDNTVHKLEYKNERVLVDSMQDKLPFPFALLSISRDGRRCLAVNRETGKYHALVLNFCGSNGGVVRSNGGERNNASAGTEKDVETNATPSATEDVVESSASANNDKSVLSPFFHSPEGVFKDSLVKKDDTNKNMGPFDSLFSIGTLAVAGGAALAVIVFAYRLAFR